MTDWAGSVFVVYSWTHLVSETLYVGGDHTNAVCVATEQGGPYTWVERWQHGKLQERVYDTVQGGHL